MGIKILLRIKKMTERELSLDNGHSNYISLEELKDYFECPICLNVPRKAPIWQCDKGHTICSSCRPKVVTCPQCRARYTAGNRNYFAERLLERVPVPCSFLEQGCEVELVPSKIKKHELECDYRDIVCAHMVHGCRVKCIKREMDHHMATCHYKPMPCPVSDCNLKIPQKLLMQHLQKDHKILNKQDGVMDMGTMNCILMIILLISVAFNFSFMYI